MLLNLINTGLLWYYFNVLAIAVIVYMILKLAIVRAKKAVTNQAESESTEDKMFIMFAMFTASFAMVFFFMREYIDDFERIWQTVSEAAGEIKNG
jgi:ABC-type polysaccharide/polyol phosphate export permease